MLELLARPAFRVHDEVYTFADVALAAALWGDWDRLREDTRAGLCCLRSYRDAQRPLPEAEIDEAAVDFRYAHEMVTAQEAEAWLQQWGISAAEWMDAMRREVLRRKHQSRLGEIVATCPVDDDDVTAASGIDAVCSGLFTRLTPKLAARAALHNRIRSSNGGPPADDVIGGVERGIPIPQLPFDATRIVASRRRLAEMELSLQEFRAGALTPRSVADQIAAHHLDWIRVDYQVLSFPAEAMAREAVLCVREDGMSFESLAADTGVAQLRDETQWIGDVKGPMHGALLGARPGEIIGPIARGGNHEVYRLTTKRLPAASDAAVQERAERSIMHRALAAELNERVQWLTTL